MLTVEQIRSMTPEQVATALADMQGKLDAAKRSSMGKLTLKVSAKGALSVYGMGRWPVTLYREQWERLLDNTSMLRDFISSHDEELKLKGDAEQAE